MDVCCECCVLSGRSLCDGLITRPEESYRLWCVVVCDLEKPWIWGGHSPRLGCKRHKKSKDLCQNFVHYFWTLSALVANSLFVMNALKRSTSWKSQNLAASNCSSSSFNLVNFVAPFSHDHQRTLSVFTWIRFTLLHSISLLSILYCFSHPQTRLQMSVILCKIL